jgi:hypothetical protein
MATAAAAAAIRKNLKTGFTMKSFCPRAGEARVFASLALIKTLRRRLQSASAQLTMSAALSE